jgi:hypothetical protein
MHGRATFCALLWAAPAVAEPVPGVPGEVRLVSGAEVQALCREVAPLAEGAPAARRGEREEALGGLYVMTLPSSAFGFQGFDAARGRLPFEPRFRSSTGSYELVLHDLDPDGESIVPFDLAVPATSREAAALARQRRGGELALTLWFRLPAAPGKAVCATVHSRDGAGVRLAVDPVGFHLSRRGQGIAAGQAPELAELRGAGAPVGQPRVVVARPVLTRSRGHASEPVARAASALEPELLGCYKSGLAGEPALRGTLVVGVAVDGEGRVTEARAELDGLGAPGVTSCVVSRFRAARFPRAADRFSMPIRFSSAD